MELTEDENCKLKADLERISDALLTFESNLHRAFTLRPAHLLKLAVSRSMANSVSSSVNPAFAEIIVVRHGETVWNTDGRIQGHLDVELNNVGRQQAASVGYHSYCLRKQLNNVGRQQAASVSSKQLNNVGRWNWSSSTDYLEMPSVLLMATMRNVQIARPTMYQVVKDMVDKMGYTVKLVRVTKRVHEAYFAHLYLTKIGDETQNVSFDLRPSDAINIAVRCKVPIQVNKYLAYSDGMRVVESGKLSTLSLTKDGLYVTELDRPGGQPCLDTKEFNLVINMVQAVNQERYDEAAELRDKLSQFRAKRNLRKFT